MAKRKTKKMRTGPPLPTIGWREWVALPDLNIDAIKAKIDTGARSSALHAFEVKIYTNKKGVEMVRFSVHPMQRNTKTTITTRAPLKEWRKVKSSVGHVTKRPVIETELHLLNHDQNEKYQAPAWNIELTLINRDEMGFRMLLGRQALRKKVTIDPGKSFRTGKPR